MRVEVITPRKIEFQGEADDVVLPTLMGEIAVLSLHAPLISVLKPGRIKIKTLPTGRQAKGEEIIIQADGGILQVAENSATILLKNFHTQ
jgi:F-type H+-transporting ATPase subunit epsilon